MVPKDTCRLREAMTRQCLNGRALARDVSDLRTSVKWMAWAIGIGIPVMALALTIVGVIAALK